MFARGLTGLLALVVLLGSAVWSAPATAETDCKRVDASTGECMIRVEVPGGPSGPGDSPGEGPRDSGSGASCYWDGTSSGIPDPPPGPVPCSNDFGYWSNALNCYVRLADPQPSEGDPAWQGHEPGDGNVYECWQPQTDLQIQIWLATPPPNSGAGPTPREVAQLAVDRMNLRAIEIGIVPEPGPDRIGIVGMPVYMWVKDPDEHTWGPITATASAGGVTISATARVESIQWDMGDGTKVTCHNKGTPYKSAYGRSKSPTCGHTYETESAGEPGDKFTVTATSSWVVSWEGAGQSGTIRLNGLQRSVRVAVGEAQVLVQ
ncbi:hypothetical protein AFL01nite_02510 [Aeromicrobium flavum]|uniref:ATP/GTP-binding protein n=1 Tax=Aeromicrobium flavum TaxID=416568 RepID=A0A512HR38_9ACTN|nr:hypothetical protein AFL01nite_02510 [Aeromicrobium flavum]